MGSGSGLMTRILKQAQHCLLFLQVPLAVCHGVDFSYDLSRKLRHGSIGEVGNHNNYLNDPLYSFSLKIMTLVVTSMLIFGCAWPWVRRKDETPHTPLHKDAASMDSASTFHTPTNFERVRASPMRFSPPSPQYPPRSTNKLGPVPLSFNQLEKATRNFSPSCCIGEGSSAMVYKGRIPPNGQEVAIKRVRKDHFESDEFKGEVEILPQVDHWNLVRLIGIIDNGSERLIVTEYVSNGTLRQHLNGERGRILDFNQRLDIAIDIAHGLTYLHSYAGRKIIHRDLKSSNIFLTDAMRAKVADFGLAKVGPEETDRSHISTKVKGTLGYLDPDYMRTYQLTTKSDVYSFGILLLEILTGRFPVDTNRPINERVLITWSFYKYNEGNVAALVDPQMMNEKVNTEIIRKMFELAINCAGPPIRDDRPEMRVVGERLWAIRIEYNRSRQ